MQSAALPQNPTVIVSMAQPRAKAYQRMRWLDGPHLIMTCSTRGICRLYRVERKQVAEGRLVERLVRLSGTDAHDALERAIRAGYDVVRISDELRERAGAPKRRRAARVLAA